MDAGKVEIPGEIEEALRAINEESPKLASVSDVEVAYKRFCGMLTEATCALNALGHLEKPNIPPDLPSVAGVRTKLEELRQQKEKLVAQKVEAASRWEGAQARLKQVQEEMEGLSSEILSPDDEQELLQLESQRGHAEKLRQELTELMAEQKAVEASLAAAVGLKGECPTCGQAVCEEVKTKELRRLQERLADLEGRVQGAREELSDLAGIEVVRLRLEDHRKALARRAALEGEKSQLQGVKRPDVDSLDSRTAILVERINKGERVLGKVQQFESVKDRWESHAREGSALEWRTSQLDRLVEFFGPNGALKRQIGGRIGSFTEDLNRHLAAFEYTCNLALEPFELRVSASRDSRFGLPLKHLSESERFRFGVAFQSALAMVTGLRFVVIDRADVLDKEKRKMLTSLLLNSELDQAIVLATSEEVPPSIMPEGVKFLGLVEGTKRGEAPVSTAV